MSEQATPTLADWERAEIARANASELTPVVFVHGLWLLSSSWQPWRDFFEDNGLHHPRAGLARRPGDRRRGTGASRGVREEDGAGGHRPLPRGDRRARPGARRDRPLVRRPHRPEDRRRGRRRGHRLDRQRAVQGRAAAAGVVAEVRVTGALATRRTPSAGWRSRSSSSSTAGPTRSTRPRRGSSTRRTTCPPPARRSSRRRSRTSTRSAARRRSTRRIPSAARCSSSAARRTTPCRPRSRTRATRSRRRTRARPRRSRSPAAGTPSRSTRGWREVADEALAFVQRFIQ